MVPLAVKAENGRCRGLQVKMIPSSMLEIVAFVAYSDDFPLNRAFNLKPNVFFNY